MPLPSLSLLSRNTWPFRSRRDPQTGRANTDPTGERPGGTGPADVSDPRHADNSSRARGIRSDYRHAMRHGEIPPTPARPPAYDDALTPPAYQDTPRTGEITVDQNARGPVRSLRHPDTASQGLAEAGSEHFRDFANPFRSMSSRNQPAPIYPEQPRDARQDLALPVPPQINYLPFPHEKEISLAEALRGRNPPEGSSYQPPSNRPGAPRRGPEVAPRRGINWAAVGRGIVNGLAAMGGAPMGRM